MSAAHSHEAHVAIFESLRSAQKTSIGGRDTSAAGLLALYGLFSHGAIPDAVNGALQVNGSQTLSSKEPILKEILEILDLHVTREEAPSMGRLTYSQGRNTAQYLDNFNDHAVRRFGRGKKDVGSVSLEALLAFQNHGAAAFNPNYPEHKKIPDPVTREPLHPSDYFDRIQLPTLSVHPKSRAPESGYNLRPTNESVSHAVNVSHRLNDGVRNNEELRRKLIAAPGYTGIAHRDFNSKNWLTALSVPLVLELANTFAFSPALNWTRKWPAGADAAPEALISAVSEMFDTDRVLKNDDKIGTTDHRSDVEHNAGDQASIASSDKQGLFGENTKNMLIAGAATLVATGLDSALETSGFLSHIPALRYSLLVATKQLRAMGAASGIYNETIESVHNRVKTVATELNAPDSMLNKEQILLRGNENHISAEESKKRQIAIGKTSAKHYAREAGLLTIGPMTHVAGIIDAIVKIGLEVGTSPDIRLSTKGHVYPREAPYTDAKAFGENYVELAGGVATMVSNPVQMPSVQNIEMNTLQIGALGNKLPGWSDINRMARQIGANSSGEQLPKTLNDIDRRRMAGVGLVLNDYLYKPIHGIFSSSNKISDIDFGGPVTRTPQIQTSQNQLESA